METTTATCHTDGCASAGIPIPGLVIGWIDDATGETVYTSGVNCGVCGQPITDLVPPIPTPEPPEPEPEPKGTSRE
jgi:hypothetical protein